MAAAPASPSFRRRLAARSASLAAKLKRALPADSAVERTTAVEDLVAANHILASEGVLDAFGHVSARSPARPDRFLLSRRLAPALVTRADIREHHIDEDPPEGRDGYLEWCLHSEIYRSRLDVNAVVHCHTPSLIPFADSSVPLRPMYHMSSFIGDAVPVIELRHTPAGADLLIRDAETGRAFACSLGERPAALIRGHGAVVVGPSIPCTVGRSIYLDLNARIQARAVALGGEVRYLDPEETRALAANDYARAWEVWKRKIRARP